VHLALALLVSWIASAPGAAPPPPARPADRAESRALPRSGGAPAPRVIVERVLDAYGGRARLARVRAYRIEGTLTAVRRGRLTVPTSRQVERPNRLRIEIAYPEGPEIRILNGARGWRSDGEGGLEEVTGPFLESMQLQALRADVPWVFAEALDRVRATEPITHEGRRLLGLEFPVSSILTFRAYVNPATWRVEVSQGLLAHGGMQTHFETVYEDFRSVDGVLFAHRERNYASGAHTGWTKVERVVLNPELPPGTFAPPPPRGRVPGREG